MESSSIILWVILYVSGFAMNIAFFTLFGRMIGFDYSGPKDYSNYDDWSDNTQAYTTFSLMWPIMDTILIVWGFWTVLTGITRVFIKS